MGLRSARARSGAAAVAAVAAGDAARAGAAVRTETGCSAGGLWSFGTASGGNATAGISSRAIGAGGGPAEMAATTNGSM